MNRAATCWLVLVAAGCGSADGFESTLAYPDDSACLNCGATPPAQEIGNWSATPRVWATPDIVMFYASSSSSNGSFEPKEVVVRNTTGTIVLITQARVLDNPNEPGGEDGATFFTVEPFAEPIPIQPNGDGSVWVQFLGSPRQRSAQLELFTTDSSYGVIDVDLTGKFFIDG